MRKFSIVIPVYNCASYLRECLDSIVPQTYADWEAICVDDGSTDGSGLILDEYAERDNRFRIIHQSNRGVSAARNAALDVARGEWISFVDADDYIRPSYLANFVDCQDKFDVNFLNLTFVEPEGKQIDRILPACKCPSIVGQGSERLAAIIEGPDGLDAFGWTWNKIIRRDLIDDNGIRFVEGVSYFEDELFALDLFQYATSFQILERPVYCYRRNPAGLTSRGLTPAEFPRLMDAFVGRAEQSRLPMLKELAVKRSRSWLHMALQNPAVSSKDLADGVLRLGCRFPSLYPFSSPSGKALAVTKFAPSALRKWILTFFIAMWREYRK